MSRLPIITNPRRQSYPSDLSDAEWEILKPLLPFPKGLGHPRESEAMIDGSLLRLMVKRLAA